MNRQNTFNDLVLLTIAIFLCCIMSIQVNGFTYIFDKYGNTETNLWNTTTTPKVHKEFNTARYYSSPSSLDFENLPINALGVAYYRLNKTFKKTDNTHIIFTEFVRINSTSTNSYWMMFTDSIGGFESVGTSQSYIYTRFDTTTNNVLYKANTGSETICGSFNMPLNTFVNYTLDISLTNTNYYYTMYINGTQICSNKDAYLIDNLLYYVHGDLSSGFQMSTDLDDFCLYNTSCVDTESSPPDSTPPTVSFKEQIPSNVVMGNLFGNTLNITYNITDNVDVNNNSVYINYTVNYTDVLPNGYLINSYTNGTPDLGMKQKKPYRNITSNYSFLLSDNDLFFALYNYNETHLEEQQEYFYDCGKTQCIYYNQFYNFSNVNHNNFLELNLRHTGINPQSFSIGLCNEKSLTPLTSSNCTLIYQDITIPLNHSHQQGKANHSVLSFTFSGSNNRINGLWINNTIYPYVLTNNLPTKRWEIAYIRNESRANANMVVNNATTGYFDLNYTWNMHIHQNATYFNYYACASDLVGNFNCSETRKISISQDANLIPDSPIIINPNITNTSFTNPINNITYIDWIIGLSPNGRSINNCSLDLINYSNTVFLKHINWTDSGVITSYNWNNGINYTDVVINLTCCDTLRLCSNSLSVNFSLQYYDLAPPVVPPVSNVSLLVNMSGVEEAINNYTKQTKYNVDIPLLIVFIVLAIVLLIFGLISSYKWLIAISGAFMVISALFFGNYATNIYKGIQDNNVLYVWIFILFLIVGLAFIFIGITVTITDNIAKTEKRDFYSDINERYK